MKRRFILFALVLVWLTLTLSLFPVEFFSKSALAEKGEGAGIQELPLGIQKIYLKGNKVHILIVRSGGGKIDPGDFSKIRMKVDPGSGKSPRQWSLADVDRKKALGATGGKIEFDTGIVLEKGETVKAILSFGKWETSKQEVLSLTPTTAIAKTAPSKMMPQSKMTTATSRGKVTPYLDDSGGIRITLPSSGQSFRPGTNMNFNVLFLNDVAYGRLELYLKRMSSDMPHSSMMVGFDPSPERMAYQGTWPLPSGGLPSGSDYYIIANHASGAWGLSDNFSISAEGEGLIRILKPQAGEGVTPGFKLKVNYQFMRRVGEGTVNFELYMLDAEGKHGRPVLTTTRFHRSQPADLPEPIHQMEWQLPSDLAVGRCFVLLTHPEARGQSSNFAIQWEATGTSFPSDYAVVDIFKHRNDVKARIRATGGDMTDYVELKVEGAPTRRELIRPATDTDIVIATIPSGYICGGFYEVTIDPNNQKRETNEDNNILRKFVSFRSPDGYAYSPGGLYVLIPCEPPPGYAEFGPVIIGISNCSSGPVSTRGIVEVRQNGRRAVSVSGGGGGRLAEFEDFSEVVPHRIYVSECGSLVDRRTESEIPPGECGVVRVDIDRDLSRVDSTLTYSFKGDLRTWPSLTNPFTVQLRFGRWGTTLHTDTGRVEYRCVYGTP